MKNKLHKPLILLALCCLSFLQKVVVKNISVSMDVQTRFHKTLSLITTSTTDDLSSVNINASGIVTIAEVDSYQMPLNSEHWLCK